MMRSLAYGALCLLLTVGLVRADERGAGSTSSRSDADVAAAKDAYERALRLYNVGDYDKALELFKGAYLHKPDAAFLFNIGQCERQLHQYDVAEKSYRAFLREGAPSDEQRVSVERLIESMRQAAAKERAAAAPVERPTNAPTTTATPPAPSEQAAPAPAPVERADDAGRRAQLRRAGYVLAGLTAAALVTGAVLVGLSQSAQSTLESDSRQGQTFTPSLQNMDATAQNESTAGIACLIAAGALGVSSGVTLALGFRPSRAREKVALVPTMSPRGGGLALVGAF